MLGGSKKKEKHDLDDIVRFGKYKDKGYTYDHVLSIDPHYLRWAMNNTCSFKPSEELKYAINASISKENWEDGRHDRDMEIGQMYGY